MDYLIADVEVIIDLFGEIVGFKKLDNKEACKELLEPFVQLQFILILCFGEHALVPAFIILANI